MQWQAGQSVEAHHAVSLGLHLLNGLLICAIGRWRPMAVFLTGVWWLHPIQTESVAYLSSRADLLLVTCVLLGIWSKRTALLWACVAIWVKESGVMVGPLLWLWHGQRRLLVPIVMGLIWGVWIWPAMGTWTPPSGDSALWYAAVQSAALWRGLSQLIWPFGFTVLYDWPTVDPIWPLWASGGAVALLLAGLRPRWRLACWWPLVALAPRFLVRLPDYLHDHHLPLAFLGLVLVGFRKDDC